MAFSGGVFSLVAGNPVVSGTTISSTWANNTLNDIATGLSTCVLKDGSQTITANMPMNSFKFTGLANGSAATDSAAFGQIPVVATQAQQEAGSSTAVYTSPGKQQNHPSAAKSWIAGITATGTPAASNSYNVTSVGDGGVGVYTINMTTGMSAVAYCGFATIGNSGGTGKGEASVDRNASASSYTLYFWDSGGTAQDPTYWNGGMFGDQS